MTRKALGRGLNALLRTVETTTAGLAEVAVEQIDAIGADLGAFAGKYDISLIATGATAARHVERVETGFRADREDRGGNIDRIRRIDHQPHMLQLGALAKRDDDRVVDLIGLRAVSGDKALQQRRARALADGQEGRERPASSASCPSRRNTARTSAPARPPQAGRARHARS